MLSTDKIQEDNPTKSQVFLHIKNIHVGTQEIGKKKKWERGILLKEKDEWEKFLKNHPQ